MFKEIRDCFGFVFLYFVIGLTKLALFSQPIRFKPNTNRVFPRFRSYQRAQNTNGVYQIKWSPFLLINWYNSQDSISASQSKSWRYKFSGALWAAWEQMPHLNLFLRSSWNLSTNFLACDKRVALRLWLWRPHIFSQSITKSSTIRVSLTNSAEDKLSR